MNARPATALVACAFLVTSLAAQTRPAAPAAPSAKPPAAPPAPPAAPAAPTAPAQRGQPINIKVELTITDLRSSTLPDPVKKTVTVVAGDGLSGQVRSSSTYSGAGGSVAPLNLDVEPTILPNGKIRTHLSLAYDMPAPRTNEPSNLAIGTLTRTAIQETLWLILEDGKTLTISQSADPVTDRQVMVEVKATILK